MASQIISFIPSVSANFQFQASIDGQFYNCICTFNAYGQRYYLSIYDLSQNPKLSRPIIASPDGANINIGAGYFTDTIVFRQSSQNFEIPGLPPPTPIVTRPPMPAI